MLFVLLVVVGPSLCLAVTRVEVVKSWSAVVTEGSPAKLACKGSSGLVSCVWRKSRGRLELSSETTFGRRDNEEVTVGSTGRGGEDNMCFLTIKESNRDYDGDWECELHGECPEEDFSAIPPVDFNDEDHWAGRRRRQARRRGEGPECDNVAVKAVRVKVVGQDELSLLPAQDTYHANLDSTVVLTVRTNEPFTRCTISQGRDTKVEIGGTARRDECITVGGRRGTRACASVTQGVPSCLLTIDNMITDVAGRWSFEIEREVGGGRPRTLKQTASVELVLVELPTQLYLKYNGVEFRGDRNDVIVAKVGDRAIFHCIATGGVPRPQVELFLASRNESGVQRTCRSPNRNSICAGFEVELAAYHDSQMVTCVARMPGVDLDDQTEGNSGQLVYNGLERSVPLSLGYKARLIDPVDKFDNTSVVICDTGLCEGRDYELLVQFEASPEPDEVEWVMRANDNRRRTVVRAGDRRKTYDAERLEDISTRRQPDRYEARILMERVEAEDMSRRTEHQLKVRNSAGTTTFSITIDTDRSCLCRASSSSSGGSSCSGRNCDAQSQTSRPSSSRPSSDEAAGPLEPLLTSCLALGSSLLDTYSPDGSQRPSRESERQFESKVEDFFREATCAGYGRQVFDLYQLKKQTKAAPLSTQDIVFTKLDPTEGVKVVKTRGKTEPIVTSELLGTAKDVVAKAEGLVIQPKANPEKSSEDVTETE